MDSAVERGNRLLRQFERANRSLDFDGFDPSKTHRFAMLLRMKGPDPSW